VEHGQSATLCKPRTVLTTLHFIQTNGPNKLEYYTRLGWKAYEGQTL